MSAFVIEGGVNLQGEIEVMGAKNSALPCLAAALMTAEPVVLTNIPEIADVEVVFKLMSSIGVVVKKIGPNSFEIDASQAKKEVPDPELMAKARASILFLGPLLARFGEVKVVQPGGCVIGARPVDTHLVALAGLGAEIVVEDSFYYLHAKEGLKGRKIVLPEASVTATENLMMAACLAEGITEIRIAACEPEIEDLAAMLTKMGAKITGAGTHTVVIEGVSRLSGCEHKIIPDRIEAGTLAIAAAVTKGNVRIKNFVADHLDYFLTKLAEAGVNFKVEEGDVLWIRPSERFNAVNIKTDVYPRFPTDLQAPFSVLLTQANGSSKIYETLFEGRFGYLRELQKMGANVIIQDPQRAVISGPTTLYPRDIKSLDLRAGATLIIAALIAQGESVIEGAEVVDRGYQKIEERLSSLGAKIKRV